MKHLTCLLVVAALCCQALAAPLTPEDARNLEARAKKVAAAFDTSDADTIVEMTHPSLFALMGGRDRMLELTRTAMTQLKAMDVEMISSALGTPTESYTAGDELVCFYPRITVMRVGEKKAKGTGYLVSVRKLPDGEWLFLDGAGFRKNPQLLETLLPALPKDVKLPENKVEVTSMGE